MLTTGNLCRLTRIKMDSIIFIDIYLLTTASLCRFMRHNTICTFVYATELVMNDHMKIENYANLKINLRLYIIKHLKSISF